MTPEEQEKEELYDLVKALRQRQQTEFELRNEWENAKKAVQLIEEKLREKIGLSSTS